MRTSILNTATTEQMGCISFFFFRLHEIYKLLFIPFLHRMFLDGVLFVLLIYKIVVIFLLVVL